MSKSLALMAVGVLATLVSVGLPPSQAVGQTGNFLTILNEQNANGDSTRSVTYFDADALGDADPLNDTPLFSVFIGYDEAGDTEELNMIDVDPATGDVYVVSFDSGTSGVVTGAGDDTIGSFDLYKIDFSDVFTHWSTNYQGQNVRTLAGPLAVGGPAPGGSKNSLNTDYVTYGDDNPYGVFDFQASHSNTFTLPGVVNKLGEVKRNNSTNPSPFFPYSLEFIDDETLLLLDDSAGPDATESAATDHEYRVLERVSTSPGAAGPTTGDNLDGGFNLGTSESWNSRRIGKVNLDFDGLGAPLGHSEPESTAYYADTATGVRGVWVTESEGLAGGDDIAFLQLDSSNNSMGYRPYSTGGTTFALDNDPAVDPLANNGKADNIFVDSDTGDIIIMESGFGDVPVHEPSVIRREVVTYDNGSGEIQFGASSPKVILNPTKTPGESSAFLERGQWAAWDSENDRVFIVNPGAASPENPPFEMDIWVIDLLVGSPTFGQTFSFLDLDESVSLFTGDSFGDKVAFFSLGSEVVNDADFDDDSDVDGNDFLIWQRGLGVGTDNATGDANDSGVVDAADLAIWQSQFGTSAVAAAGAVPEPTAVALLLSGALAGLGLRRRA